MKQKEKWFLLISLLTIITIIPITLFMGFKTMKPTDFSQINILETENKDTTGFVQKFFTDSFDEPLNTSYWYEGGTGNYWWDHQYFNGNASNNGAVWHTAYSIAGDGRARDRFPLLSPVAGEGTINGLQPGLFADADGDGVFDSIDMFPGNDMEWADTDSDGTGDNTDAFPGDPAAVLDTDGDGHPDEWHGNMSEQDSTTDLTLDHYPDDPDRWARDTVEEGEYARELLVFIVFAIIFIIASIQIKRKKIGSAGR